MSREVRIAPSILSSDFARLAEEAVRMKEAGADWLHVDVMDGRFVPNITIGPVVVRGVKKAAGDRAPLDVHLMIEEPTRYVQDFRDAGADWITVTPYDSALGVPTARARRAAITTQLVLDKECRLGHVADPLGGAHAVEARTRQLAEAGCRIMQEVEGLGGLGRCIQSGWVREHIAGCIAELRDRIQRGDHVLVGVSRFAGALGEPTEQEDVAVYVAERERERNAARGRIATGSIESVDHAIDAASEGATLTELGGALVRGAPSEIEPLEEVREEQFCEVAEEANG